MNTTIINELRVSARLVFPHLTTMKYLTKKFPTLPPFFPAQLTYPTMPNATCQMLHAKCHMPHASIPQMQRVVSSSAHREHRDITQVRSGRSANRHTPYTRR